MNALTLDPKDPAVMEAVKDCAIGDEKELLVKVKVTEVGPAVRMDVLSAKYAEPEMEEDEMEGEAEGVEAGEDYEKKMPMKKMKKGNPALAILIAPEGKR